MPNVKPVGEAAVRAGSALTNALPQLTFPFVNLRVIHMGEANLGFITALRQWFRLLEGTIRNKLKSINNN